MSRQIDAARIRDAVDAATSGDVERWVTLQDIARQLSMPDVAALQAAVRASAAGWIITSGERDVHRLAITIEGHRRARDPRSRGRRQPRMVSNL